MKIDQTIKSLQETADKTDDPVLKKEIASKIETLKSNKDVKK